MKLVAPGDLFEAKTGASVSPAKKYRKSDKFRDSNMILQRLPLRSRGRKLVFRENLIIRGVPEDGQVSCAFCTTARTQAFQYLRVTGDREGVDQREA